MNPDDEAPTALADKVLGALDRVARGHRAHRQHAATSHQLSPLQAELLVTLHDGAPPEPLVGRLAREVAVSQPTATDSIRSLEGKRLLERRPDPLDGRRALVELTPAGSALADQLVASDRRLTDAVAELTTERQEQLLEGLLELIASFVERDVIDVVRICTTCQHHELLPDGTRHCALLDTDLPPSALRVNCAEHLAVTAGS